MPIGQDQNVVTDTNGSVLDPLYQAQSPAQPQPQSVLSGVGQALGSQDIMSALSGQMTPEEAQMFALGAVPMLAGPEVKAFNALEDAIPFAAKLPKYAEEMFSEGGATIHKLQKPGRWPTYVATSPEGESYQFKDFDKAKKWVAPPPVQRPDPPASPMELPPWEEPIRAYHGSPHDFLQFDISQVGTGQGAQSYGHGLYFAEEPKVAEDYKAQLSDLKDYPIKGKDPNWRVPSWVGKTIQSSPRGIDDMIAEFRKRVVETKQEIAADPRAFQAQSNLPGLQNIVDALEAVKSGEAQLQKPGKMYEVNIKADPEHFLDWDKPHGEQSEKVQKALEKLWTDKGGSLEGRERPPFVASSNDTGYAIHAAVSTTYGPRVGGTDRDAQAAAMKALKDAGIPGIRYLDQGSRTPTWTNIYSKPNGWYVNYGPGAPKKGVFGPFRTFTEARAKEVEMRAETAPKNQTYNYVVFDDKLIDIVKKYGLAGLIAGGASNWSPDQAKAETEGREPVPLYRGGKDVTPKSAAPRPHERLDPVPEGGPKSIHSDIDKPMKVAGEVVKMQGKNPYGILGMTGKTVEEMAEKNKQNKTRATLMRALGGGADVLPINPDDK